MPLPLDLHDGRAFVSLVAFRMQGLRLAGLGRPGAWLMAPAATHELLNVRTYIQGPDDPAIYFMTEWIPNRLSVLVGPRTYGLPYRYGRLDYRHHHETGTIRGVVVPGRGGGRLVYDAVLPPSATFRPCPAGSRSAFLLERYTAFTLARRRLRRFRIVHEPWLRAPVTLDLRDTSALRSTGSWPDAATLLGAEYSPGVTGVRIGRPHRVGEVTPVR